MNTWIVKVKAAAHLEPIVMGNIEETPGEGRAQIKEKARALVRKHFDERAKIVGIARGRVVVEVQGKWFDWADGPADDEAPDGLSGGEVGK